MKLFSSYIEGRDGQKKIIRKPFVIADSKAEAQTKLAAYIEDSPRLRNLDTITAVLTEEAVIF